MTIAIIRSLPESDWGDKKTREGGRGGVLRDESGKLIVSTIASRDGLKAFRLLCT